MSCFLGCFGGAKEQPRRRRRPSPSRAQEKPPPPSDGAPPPPPLLASLLELRDSIEDLSLAVVKKKVTFDLNVTTYEAPAIEEADEAEEAAEDAEAGDTRKESGARSEAYPLNYRYDNCDDSESEIDEVEEDDDDEEDGDEEDRLDECRIVVDDDDLLGIGREEEESCESLFSLPMLPRKERNQEVNSPAPDAAPCTDMPTGLSSSGSQRNARPTSSNKENIISEREGAAFAVKTKETPACPPHSPRTPTKHELAVDASLSTWLGSSEASTVTSDTPGRTPARSYSPTSREDRPILGALTLEDIRRSSANSSPRRSPSPDDVPILGTVGRYWNCNTKGDETVTRGGFMRTRSRFAQVGFV